MKATSPPLDSKTREFLRSWGRHEMPSAQVTGGSVAPGYYRAFAVLGWIEQRNVFPVVGVQTILLRNQEDRNHGALTLGLPVTPKTELYVNALLQSFGWDGRVWPYDNDQAWPEGTADEPQVMGLLKKVGLGSTLAFPPNAERGIPTLRIHIAKRQGVFPLAPFEEIDSPPVHLERFRELVRDHSIFRAEE